ncbi:hypothetical protein BKA56DRAFT_574259 [Ilyonectria sp. MPI-CAGE-AT-0026]|nr:hypothetical protein BKA56DRAFT_574259 [Ilyonectria sp. MPI-CAGE-AT-0026]
MIYKTFSPVWGMLPMLASCKPLVGYALGRDAVGRCRFQPLVKPPFSAPHPSFRGYVDWIMIPPVSLQLSTRPTRPYTKQCWGV